MTATMPEAPALVAEAARPKAAARTAASPSASPRAVAVAIDRLVVETKQLTLDVAGVNIMEDEIVAIVGPNGAGKTTLIEALLGLRTARALDGRLFGRPFAEWHRKPALRRSIGVALQRASLPFGLKVADVVAMHDRLYGSSDPIIVEALGIAPLVRKTYDWLSRGERQRVDLMLALAPRPRCAFLDEPYTGLDGRNALALHAAIQRSRRGTTLLMACHSALELALADRAAWIADGRLVALEAPDALRRRLLGEHLLRIKLPSGADAAAVRGRLSAQLRPRFQHLHGSDEITFYGGSELQAAAQDLIAREQALSIEFGRTTLTDLLHRCASGGEDA